MYIPKIVTMMYGQPQNKQGWKGSPKDVKEGARGILVLINNTLIIAGKNSTICNFTFLTQELHSSNRLPVVQLLFFISFFKFAAGDIFVTF